MSVQFFNHNDWVKTSFHFIENGGGGRVLPLQWFSVVVKWFEIWFLALHPSSSNYWMLIFSPTMIAWKLHFIFYRFGDCFSLCTHSSSHWVRHYYFNLWLQLSLFVPRYSLLITLATATIIPLIILLYRSLLLTWGETITSLPTAYDSVDWISFATHGATRYYLHIHIFSSFTCDGNNLHHFYRRFGLWGMDPL